MNTDPAASAFVVALETCPRSAPEPYLPHHLTNVVVDSFDELDSAEREDPTLEL